MTLLRGVLKIALFWIFAVGIGYVGYQVYYAVFASYPEKLAHEYGIPESQVVIQPKPHGCDFADAPLGDKHCHYERKKEIAKDEHGRVTSVYVYWNKIED